jgi:outer membrane protein TolC
MQVDVFALLTEARQRVASLRAAIDAKREFWLAQSNLQTAINGGGSDDGSREGKSQVAATVASTGEGH